MAIKNFKRTTSRKPSSDQLNNEISKLAYQYFVDRGYEHGNEMDDWLRAERVINSKYNLD